MTIRKKKSTDHPGYEPGTFGVLVQCSTNWANEWDGRAVISSSVKSVTLEFSARSLDVDR